MNSYNAAIFVMDGLLLDSERIALDAFEQTCAQHQLPALEDVFQKCVGATSNTSRLILKEALGGLTNHERFYDDWSEIYWSLTDRTIIPLKDSARELLDYLTSSSIPTAVATSTKTEKALEAFRKEGFEIDFKSRFFGSATQIVGYT